jgi:hypothetical protein
MAVDLQTFEPTYQLTERGAQVVSRLKTLVSRADQVLLATDPDREGEAISWHLLQVLCPRSYPLGKPLLSCNLRRNRRDADRFRSDDRQRSKEDYQPD